MANLDQPDADVVRRAISNLPIGRLGDPEKDIGRTAVFLSSEDSDFITGQTILVDGGSFMV